MHDSGVWRRKVNFCFQYRITYENGQSYDRSQQVNVKISKDEYKKIVGGVLSGTPISEIEGISDALARMKDEVQFIDRWTDMNGKLRKASLKKPRAISNIEFFLLPSEYEHFRKMKNPMTVLERPEEHITIYRDDDSYVTISSINGKVEVRDSRHENTSGTYYADDFISRISFS